MPSKTKLEPKTAQPKRPRGRPKKITAAFTPNGDEHIWKIVDVAQAQTASLEELHAKLKQRYEEVLRECHQYQREAAELRHLVQIIRAVVAI